MRVVLHPEGLAECRAAALGYEEQREGLAETFSDAITAILERIARAPEAFPVWPGIRRAVPIRRAMVERFPYAVAFEYPITSESDKQVVVVLAIAHTKRQPLYWLARGSQIPVSGPSASTVSR